MSSRQVLEGCFNLKVKATAYQGEGPGHLYLIPVLVGLPESTDAPTEGDKAPEQAEGGCSGLPTASVCCSHGSRAVRTTSNPGVSGDAALCQTSTTSQP